MEHFEEITKSPMYLKAKEIFDAVKRIAELIDEEDKMLGLVKDIMMSLAVSLPSKIAGASVVEYYDLKMEYAALIRKDARELKLQNHSLKAHNFEHVEYYNIVRDLIDEFRLLFIAWVADFDKTNYIIDEWGLFNPDGVSPFDKDDDE